MDLDALLAVLERTSSAVGEVLSELSDWGLAGTKPGQYRSDLAADDVATRVLIDAGLGVLSEESGLHYEERELLAVLDPLDGSTNASRGLPWFATSICVLDTQGPLVARVVNHPGAVVYEAVRGHGATRDGSTIAPSTAMTLRQSVVALSGFPETRLSWRQYRVYGACALDLCAVADGTFDAYLDCVGSSHGVWDYAGAMLVCKEAGATFGELDDRDLVTRVPTDRRNPIAAATSELYDELVSSYRSGLSGPPR